LDRLRRRGAGADADEDGRYPAPSIGEEGSRPNEDAEGSGGGDGEGSMDAAQDGSEPRENVAGAEEDVETAAEVEPALSPLRLSMPEDVDDDEECGSEDAFGPPSGFNSAASTEAARAVAGSSIAVTVQDAVTEADS
jgi:hypothetical protein